MINRHDPQQQNGDNPLFFSDLQKYLPTILKTFKWLWRTFRRMWRVFCWLLWVLRKPLIVVLCCLMVYVLAFICLSRLSLRIQNAIYGGNYGTIMEDRCIEYYYLPYSDMEIMTNAQLEFLFWKLVIIFHPLERIDYHLTGYRRGSALLVDFGHDVAINTDIAPESLNYLIQYTLILGPNADPDVIRNSPLFFGELAMISQKVRLSKDYEKVLQFLEEYPVETHEISARFYHLFRLLDALELKYE